MIVNDDTRLGDLATALTDADATMTVKIVQINAEWVYMCTIVDFEGTELACGSGHWLADAVSHAFKSIDTWRP